MTAYRFFSIKELVYNFVMFQRNQILLDSEMYKVY